MSAWEPAGRREDDNEQTVVIGTEHVQRAFEAALELAQQVTEIGGEIRGDTVLAHHDAILQETATIGARTNQIEAQLQAKAARRSIEGALS